MITIYIKEVRNIIKNYSEEELRIFIRENIMYMGLDLHLWQEIFLELTPDLFVLVLPEGVCGNTVNRFITSVQHYLTPDFEVYIGDENYKNFIEQSMGKCQKIYEKKR